MMCSVSCKALMRVTVRSHNLYRIHHAAYATQCTVSQVAGTLTPFVKVQEFLMLVSCSIGGQHQIWGG